MKFIVIELSFVSETNEKMCIKQVQTDITKEEMFDAFGEEEMEIITEAQMDIDTLYFKTVKLVMSIWGEKAIDKTYWVMLCIHQQESVLLIIEEHFSMQAVGGSISNLRSETAKMVRNAIAVGVENFHCWI